MIRFIHSADWQIGKPFARVEDAEKRTLLRSERIEVIRRIAAAAREQDARFVLVAGDLFDSVTPDKSTVSAACGVIGALGVPLYSIPGNHDYAAPGSIWEQDFFLHERERLAPQWHVLDKPEPVILDDAVILPCPLTRRQETADPLAWLQDPQTLAGLPPDKPRIVLAHGSVQDFGNAEDEEDDTGSANRLFPERLDTAQIDYIALGDWHGAREAGGKAWYAGTPELDRFMKGGDYNPGNILAVELAGRGSAPLVTIRATARFNWLSEEFHLAGAASLPHLEARLDELLGARTREDLLQLRLSGTCDITGELQLRRLLERIEARLLRLKLYNQLQMIPSEEEMESLTRRPDDPLIAAMAGRLVEDCRRGGEDAPLARQALRELFVAVATAAAGR